MDTLGTLQSAIGALDVAQKVTAGAFNTFLIVHLSSPIAAAIAKSGHAETAASGFMVLGRVWYQGEWSEAVLVWGALTVHVISGVGLRATKRWERKLRRERRRRTLRQEAELGTGKEDEINSTVTATLAAVEDARFDPAEEKDTPPTVSTQENTVSIANRRLRLPFLSPTFTLQHLAGYVLIPFVVSHATLHRLIPASISNLSPTLFSYSFVSYSLSSRSRGRILHAASYVALTSIGMYHALVGIRIMANPTAPRSLAATQPNPKDSRLVKAKKRGWKTAYVGVVAGVGIGLARLAAEGHLVPEWMARKYDVVMQTAMLA